jgi:hypothetical protein
MRPICRFTAAGSSRFFERAMRAAKRSSASSIRRLKMQQRVKVRGHFQISNERCSNVPMREPLCAAATDGVSLMLAGGLVGGAKDGAQHFCNTPVTANP